VACRAHLELRAKVTSGENDTFFIFSQMACRAPS
jgi:hypothetical protein